MLLKKQDWQLDEKVEEEETGRESDLPFSTMVEEHVPWWIGFVIALVLVLFVGFVFKGYIGRQIWRSVERGVQRVPVLRVIYPYAKQVTEFFFSEKKKMQYDAAVAVQYPRKGLWSIGFVTGEAMQAVRDEAGDVITIFVPSSPTPFTGYTITVPRSDTIELAISVDEALKFTVSGGVLVPDTQRSALLESPDGPALPIALPEAGDTTSEPPPEPPEPSEPLELPRTAVPLQKDNQDS